MLKECENCHIWEDKVCDECARYQECIDNQVDFVTGENAPEKDFDGCFRCAFLTEDGKGCKLD